MNVKYRSVLAAALSVGLMVQAPVVAFATDEERVVFDNGAPTQATQEADLVGPDQGNDTYELAKDVSVQTGTAVSVDGNATLESYNDTISSTDVAISAEDSANVYVVSGAVTGDVVNSGSGLVYVAEADRTLNGDVTNSGSGATTVFGNVDGSVTNSNGTTTIVGSALNDVSATSGKVIVLGGIDGSISGASHVYTGSATTHVDGLNYIVHRGNGVVYHGIYSGNLDSESDLGTPSNYSLANKVTTGPMSAGDGTSTTNYDYANAGNVLIFSVQSGYSMNTVGAEYVRDGLYKLVVPAGGNVYLTAAQIQQIKEKIKEETGASDVVISNESNESQEDSNASSQGGISVITTSAGADLPLSLGVAPVATKSVSLDISKVSPAQLRDTVVSTVSQVPAGGAFLLETNEPACFDKNMIQAFATRSDVSINVVFKCNGQKLRVVIPAGYDVSTLLDENGYCGFLRLAGILGYTVIG